MKKIKKNTREGGKHKTGKNTRTREKTKTRENKNIKDSSRAVRRAFLVARENKARRSIQKKIFVKKISRKLLNMTLYIGENTCFRTCFPIVYGENVLCKNMTFLGVFLFICFHEPIL